MGKASASVVLSVLASLSLAACTPAASEPTSSPSASATRSATAPGPAAGSTPAEAGGGTSSSAPTPAPTPSPGEGGTSSGDGASAGTPLSAQGAYDACRNGAWEAAANSPEELSWASLEDSYVVQAGDAWRIYIEYVRTSGEAGTTFDGAASCVFRGTAEAPVAERVGAGLRDDPTSEAYWAPLGE